MRIRMTATLLLAIAGEAGAQEKVATEDMEKATLAKEKKEDGWKASAKIGLTGSLSSNRMYVGAEDGTTIQVGTVLGLGAELNSGQHRWENALALQLGGSKTPQIDRFVKSSDVLDLTSAYFYTLESIDWFGLFGRVKLASQMLPTTFVRSVPYTVVRQDRAGVEIDRTMVEAQQGIESTETFEPLTLREVAGIFVNPHTTDAFTIKVRLGAAAQEIVARDGFVLVADDPATTTMTLAQLESSFELGLEAGLSATGVLYPDVLNWKLNVDLFQPFVTTSDTELSTIAQLNSEIVLGVSLKLVEWLSIEYLLTAKRIPLILDDWQVQNLLVLSAGFDLI
jgi:hypothetical protein